MFSDDTIFFDVAVAAIAIFLITRFILKRYGFFRWGGAVDGPILSSIESLSTGELLGVQKGEAEGFSYVIMTNPSGRLMVFVSLLRKTNLHMIAFGSKSQTNLISKRAAQALQQAVLEGDFPKYFKMYCRPEDQATLRQVFDPSDMAYFADFCQVHNLEIYGDTLYISQAGNAHDENDTTGILDDLKAFLKRNKHTLQRI